MDTAASVTPYYPPRPRPLPSLAALARVVWSGDGNLLNLLPADAYRMEVGRLGYSRRSILLVNEPDLLRDVLTDPSDIYPKNDLMVGALEPLVGNSIFVCSGETWRRQRRMIDPAFSHMRVTRAFAAMSAALDDCEADLDDRSDRGEPISLDRVMSHLTADIIWRTMFSTSLQSRAAREVFEAFTLFERRVAQVELKRLIFAAPFARIPQHERVLDACRRIRRHLGDLVDAHLADGRELSDIAADVIAARDRESGRPFSREELIDQLGVFFLAGHETTASVLIWAFFILATQARMVARMRAEIDQVAGDGPVEFEHLRQLAYVRNLFRETLRLYPPITFIPRVAAEPARIGPFQVSKGTMIMVAPWTLHRHEKHWADPHRFDPDRFTPEREAEIRPGTYIPFGLGPRTCVGAGFAQTEGTLILARLIRRYDFTALAPDKVRPVARLTTRPAEQIMCRVDRRQA